MALRPSQKKHKEGRSSFSPVGNVIIVGPLYRSLTTMLPSIKLGIMVALEGEPPSDDLRKQTKMYGRRLCLRKPRPKPWRALKSKPINWFFCLHCLCLTSSHVSVAWHYHDCPSWGMLRYFELFTHGFVKLVVRMKWTCHLKPPLFIMWCPRAAQIHHRCILPICEI